MVIRGANTFVIWKNLQCIVIVDPDPKCTVVVPGFRYVKLDKQTLLSYADKPAYGLPEAFVTDALGKGDECHAILHGDDLASLRLVFRKSRYSSTTNSGFTSILPMYTCTRVSH